MLKQIILLKQYETRYISTLVNSKDPDQLAPLENSVDPDPADQEPHCLQCKMLARNNSSKYEIQNCIDFIHCTCPRTSNRNFGLVLNEMGPGQTGWAWCF